jgi:hypothetical protein
MPSARTRLAYTLHIQLGDIEPVIWRRIVVPGSLTLRQLHHVLQVTMGWTHSHLHEFLIPNGDGETNTPYGEPSPEDDYFHQDDRRIHLAQVAPKEGASFTYIYDFGDHWVHRVTVEQIELTAKNEPPYPDCLDGSRACPPEDCGGVSGFARFLEAWRNPLDPDHQQMREWVGRHYRPEVFSVPQVNSALALFISYEHATY